MADEAKPTPSFPDQMAAQYPNEYAAALKAIGSDAEYGSDAEKELAASYALKQHAGELFQFFHHQMNRNDGVAIDLSAAPNLAAKLAAEGVTTQDVRDFARGLYPEETPDEAVRHYQRDVERAGGKSVAEPKTSPFGNPF